MYHIHTIGDENKSEMIIAVISKILKEQLKPFAMSGPEEHVAISMALLSSAFDSLTGFIHHYGGEEISDKTEKAIDIFMKEIGDNINEVCNKVVARHKDN